MAVEMAHEGRGRGGHEGAAAGEVDGRRLLDLGSVAYMLSLSRAEVEREVARGRLASIKHGRRRLVSRSQLEAYIRRLERGDVA